MFQEEDFKISKNSAKPFSRLINNSSKQYSAKELETRLWDSILQYSAVGIPDSVKKVLQSEVKLKGKLISQFSFEKTPIEIAPEGPFSKEVTLLNEFEENSVSEESVISDNEFESEMNNYQRDDLIPFERESKSNRLDLFKELPVFKKLTFKRLFRNLNKTIPQTKIFLCSICGKKYFNHAALGGHRAKNHPNTSLSFAQRQKTFQKRKSERDKKLFFKNL